MGEWAVAGLIGAVAGYGVRLWQEKLPNVVKQPAEAAVRTVGSALGAGASMGGRAAGAVLRTATQPAATRVGGKPLLRVPVSGGGRTGSSTPRSRRSGSTRTRPASKPSRGTGRQRPTAQRG
jgi:hypothetical protein